MLLLTSFDVNFLQKIIQGTLSVSNRLDPDQDQHSVGADRGLSCLQRIPADDKRSC